MASSHILSESCLLEEIDDDKFGGFRAVWFIWPLVYLGLLAGLRYNVCKHWMKSRGTHAMLLLLCLFMACVTFLAPFTTGPPFGLESLEGLTCKEVDNLPRIVDLSQGKTWADVYGTAWKSQRLVVKRLRTTPRIRPFKDVRPTQLGVNDTDPCSDRQHVKNEGEISGLFEGNRYVVQRVKYCSDIPAIVYQYYPGTLLEILFDLRICGGSRWSLGLVLRMCIGIARSVEALHSASEGPVVHGEINPGQFMVDSSGGIRIGDFHHSSHPTKGLVNYCNNMAGGRYVATEQVFGDKPTTASDVYSLGMMIWTVFTREYAFEEKQKSEVWKEIVAGIRPVIPETMPILLSNIVASCWDSDPNERPTAERVRQDLESLQQILYPEH